MHLFYDKALPLMAATKSYIGAALEGSHYSFQKAA
jgi:hypothetical protein